MVFLIVLALICKYAPVFAATNKEKRFITYKIKYPHVFVIK